MRSEEEIREHIIKQKQIIEKYNLHSYCDNYINALEWVLNEQKGAEGVLSKEEVAKALRGKNEN